MRLSRIFVIVLYTFLFLFYPGDSYYVRLFFYNRDLFAAPQTTEGAMHQKVPYVLNTATTPMVTAQGVYVADLESFTPIFEKRANNRFLPASTTKILTALVAFDAFELDKVLKVKRVVSEGQVAGLVKGENITFENLLYGLLVQSGNDTAFVLADNYPGGEKEFMRAINSRAQALGMKQSHFKDPAGLNSSNQYTTPFDLALAGRALLSNKTLAKIVSIKSITVSDVDFKYFHLLHNVNKLLGEIVGVGGLKTGFTLDAGENLVTFYKKNGHQFIIVILKSEDRFEDTKRIVEWITTNVGYIPL